MQCIYGSWGDKVSACYILMNSGSKRFKMFLCFEIEDKCLERWYISLAS